MILPLSNLISRAIEQALEDDVAIAFSGGLDSAVLAATAKKHAKVGLFACGAEGSEDLECAERVSGELGLPLHRIVIDDRMAMEAYAKIYSALPLGLPKIEILVPVYHAARAASKEGHDTMLFGSAAEELFAGYERYYIYRDEGKDVDSILREEFRTLPQRDMAFMKRVCRMFSVDARFPFHDKELANLMFSVPIEERMDDRVLKKGILREAAKLLGVPDSAIKRKKKAMQYGSGMHKMLLRHSDEINRLFPPSK